MEEVYKLPTPLSDPWEQRANKVLSHFNFKYPDEIDIGYICWKYGIQILPLDEIHFPYETDKGIKCYSIPKQKNRRGIIYIKPGLGFIEKKLLLAEEFSHLYAHHSNQLNMKDYEINKDERQAKKMAAYLLIPQKFLYDILELTLDQAVIVSDIADHFLVTEEFAQYRLELVYERRVDAFVKFGDQLGTIEWMD